MVCCKFAVNSSPGRFRFRNFNITMTTSQAWENGRVCRHSGYYSGEMKGISICLEVDNILLIPNHMSLP